MDHSPDSERDREQQPPIEVPPAQLSEGALAALIESFVLREGADYGREEVAFETKVRQVRQQLGRGDVIIVFDPNTESVTLLTKTEWRKIRAAFPLGE
ncbi:MAG: YheU family protein [Bdellovibrionaceae bacterium]|nr:YheU family protein [Pseudobdellovibrionaceae bacterium]